MLDSLHVKNFRCLEDFQVSKLGRVNLIVGKNNSGKSTVLEALRLYAGNAHPALLESIAAEHDEKARTGEIDPGAVDQVQPFQDFFTGRFFPAKDGECIRIGSMTAPDEVLSIEHVYMLETEFEVQVSNGATEETVRRIRRSVVPKVELATTSETLSQALQISKGSRSFAPVLFDRPQQRARYAVGDAQGSIPCSVVGTQFGLVDELADGWDKVVFTPEEDVVREAMRIIAPEFENLTFVRNTDAGYPRTRNSIQRGARVKLRDIPRPVPLNSMGDGMLRVLQLALKIFPAKGGFLLIDEFENGLHYSVQERIWQLAFEMAQRLDIQVFATSHSWDCVESFSKVARSRSDIDGVLFRVGRSVRTSEQGRVIATVFDEAALHSITQSDVEVR
jgi:AAA15 family ATPase/GTPase